RSRSSRASSSLISNRSRECSQNCDHTEPDDWWEQFWEHSRERLDMSEEDARELRERLRDD
ncbi:MAG: hypothetical protein AAFX51_13760, partial [Cyanobacteria bacterium J06636_28]